MVFLRAAILSGCDYLENINGIGLEKALKIVSIDEKNIASVIIENYSSS
jgi:5'-3' exonuclease